MTSYKENENYECNIINKSLNNLFEKNDGCISSEIMIDYIIKNINFSYKISEIIKEEGDILTIQKLELKDKNEEEINNYLYNNLLNEIKIYDNDECICVNFDDNISIEIFNKNTFYSKHNILYSIPKQYILSFNIYLNDKKNSINNELNINNVIL